MITLLDKLKLYLKFLWRSVSDPSLYVEATETPYTKGLMACATGALALGSYSFLKSFLAALLTLFSSLVTFPFVPAAISIHDGVTEVSPPGVYQWNTSSAHYVVDIKGQKFSKEDISDPGLYMLSEGVFTYDGQNIKTFQGAVSQNFRSYLFWDFVTLIFMPVANFVFTFICVVVLHSAVFAVLAYLSFLLFDYLLEDTRLDFWQRFAVLALGALPCVTLSLFLSGMTFSVVGYGVFLALQSMGVSIGMLKLAELDGPQFSGLRKNLSSITLAYALVLSLPVVFSNTTLGQPADMARLERIKEQQLMLLKSETMQMHHMTMMNIIDNMRTTND